MLTLFPEENIITESDGQQVVLTTHRICYEHKEWGRSYNQSIMLEHITSCENHSISRYWLLVIAGLLIVLGFFSTTNGSSEILSICGLIALGLGLLFWFTRQSLVVVGSPSTKMLINVTGMNRDKVLSFINQIEQTKHKRLMTLNNKTN